MSPSLDAVSLAVFHHRLAAIAEEMGVVLCRSAFSPNIKERRDFSCAVFDAAGQMIAQAAHIPVHLGSTPESVRAAIRERPMGEGDIVLLNDPYAGGTHLPDVTLVAPVFVAGRLVAYVANRAHHADIGGIAPGSIPLATEIYQEGLRLPPVRLVERGKLDEDVLAIFLANTRIPDERRGDLLAQRAAIRVGQRRLGELAEREGVSGLALGMQALQDYSERLTRALLRRIPNGSYEAEDFLDDDGFGSGPVRIRVRVTVRRGGVEVDFAGTDSQVRGGVNANFPVTLAAVYYVFRCFAADSIPENAGFMRPIRVHAPLGTVVHATAPAAVAGGNVETSQRIVDVLLRALAPALPDRVPAASCGSMSNVAVGGRDPIRGRDFSYYETIGGGAGGGPHRPGASALQTHMTNTMNTPVEAIEAELPLRIVRYAVRRRSGGAGLHRGGDGIEREVEFLSATQVTLLTERRTRSPFGLRGGSPGTPGRNEIRTGGGWRRLPGKVSLTLEKAGRLRVLTPGGGGWGTRKRP